jgi:hypothetical protein
VREHWAKNGRGGKLLMSFHGVPRFHLDRGDPYHCECRKTGRLLAEALDLKPDEWILTFQSRFGKAEWLQPYTQPTLEQMGRDGTERVDVICPGFVADCLETLEEIAVENRDAFIGAGGKQFHYIPCLNERDDWIRALSLQRHELRESMIISRGPGRSLVGGGAGLLPAASDVQLSDSGRAALSNEATAIEESLESVERDPMLRLIRAMVAMLTGREVRVLDARELTSPAQAGPAAAEPSRPSDSARGAPARAGFAAEYRRHEAYSEIEQTSFQASGVVRTAAGEEIQFSISLEMSRSYHRESDVSIQFGDARPRKDPLVLNFAGTAAQLSSQRFSFDLDADGRTEEINFVRRGSGFLALDRNGDGKINNGLELFGARSGDGFAELAALDDDGNGWIDSGDEVFEKLRIWSKDGGGKDQLLGLAQAGIGALSVASVDSPFALKNSANELQGQIRATGLYLREDGGVGTVQQGPKSCLGRRSVPVGRAPCWLRAGGR